MHSYRRVTISLAILTITSFSAAPSAAQSPTQPNELQAIYACKSIPDAQERLACYDNSVGRFEAAEKNGEVVTVTKTAIEKVERDAFGFNIPSLPSLGRFFSNDKTNTKKDAEDKHNVLTAPVKQATTDESIFKPEKPPEFKAEIKSSIITNVALELRKVSEFGYKKKRFFMTNGQVWEQIGTTKLRIPKAKNGKANIVEIRKAAMGSFLLQINGKGSAIRVKRVR